MPSASGLMHAAVWSQLLPPAALLARGRLAAGPRPLIGLAMLASVAGDTAQFLMARRGINNLWVGYVSTAISGILVLSGLSLWAPTRRSSRLIRLALPVYVIVWATMVFEDVQGFSVLTIPVHSVLVLLVSLGVVIGNALEARELPLPRSDWFWVGLGLALLYGASSAMQPLLNVMMAQNQISGAMAVLNVKAGIQLVAILMIVTGMLCPLPPRSGLSFLPAR